jgi:Protein of unknown function (DUF3618)
MTSSGPAWPPAEQQAAAAATSAQDMTGTFGQAGAEAEAAGPDDTEQLREEIAQTREQLGETVEQLAAKADVTSRAKDKASELSGRLKGRTAAARRQAVSAGRAGSSQLQARAAAVGTPVREATPEAVRRAAAKATGAARQRPIPLAMASGALIVAYLAIRQCRKR